MDTPVLNIEKKHIDILLTAANADAALLYLYTEAGRSLQDAQKDLHFSATRLECAAALLRQLGLAREEKTHHITGERPSYSETDVMQAMNTDTDFKRLYGEVQRTLGKCLTTEELKVLLGLVRYLGFTGDMISLLVAYCRERARRKGSSRMPSLRTMEKEAYAWADMGIDSAEEAIAYISAQNLRFSRLGELLSVLQIRGRSLTPGEERYANAWLDMGFRKDALAIAYERTCLNTGGMNWAYMNKILLRWHEAGLHTVADIQKADKKPSVPKGASGQLGQAELEAIQRILQED
jgi:DnaD/phage-associated family protein